MKGAVALIASPLVALVAQAVMFASVMPACASRSVLWLHGTAALALAATVAMAVLARSEARRGAQHPSQTETPAEQATRHFLARAGTAVSLLASLMILLLWFVATVQSPCAPWP